MKKVYLGLLSLAVMGSLHAQTTVIKAPIRKMNSFQEAPSKTHVGNTEKGVTLFTYDFSNASLWSFADNSSTSSGDNWVIGTTAPSGSFAINPIASTTAANGFALFDSDLLCSNDQNADVRLVSPMDLSASPNISLQFESFYRKFQGNCYVIASTDGVNWTQFEVHGTLTGNQSTANPTTVQVNLSSVIGGSSTAYIGFRYIGGCDYAWMVDDVKIIETDDYDIAINNLFWGVEGAWGARLPYYSTPVAQIAPIKFGGVLENKGAIAQNDCVFNIAIPSASYASNSAQGVLTPNGIDTLDATATFIPTATPASFSVNSGVTSGATDANTADNSFNSLTFATTQHIFARDAQTMTSGSFNQGEGFELGNIFDITTNATLKGADIHIHPNTNVGAEIYATLYSIDASTNDFVYIAQTPLHTVTTAELNTVVTLVFNGGQSLTAGEPYLLVVGSYGDGGATDDLVVGTSGISEPQTTFFLEGTDNVGEWFYSTSTAMVRMNFNPTLSINENELNASVNVFPNPAVEEFTVTVDGNEATGITVVDLTGKVVYSSSVNGTITVNTSNFAAGMYTVNVETTAGIASKKLIVRK
jgi:hypothetical protein